MRDARQAILIEEEIGRLLAGKGLMLAVAESCTGGLVGHRITSISGSSCFFSGGVIAYSNEVKARVLGVAREDLKLAGAVSETVAKQMAEGVRERLGADLGIAITGIAGPAGGTEDKPVGLVYVALAGEGYCRAARFEFGGKDRAEIKNASAEAALAIIRSFLKGEDNG